MVRGSVSSPACAFASRNAAKSCSTFFFSWSGSFQETANGNCAASAFPLRRACEPSPLQSRGPRRRSGAAPCPLLFVSAACGKFRETSSTSDQIAVAKALAIIHFRAAVAIALEQSYRCATRFPWADAFFPPPKYCSYSIFSWRMSLSSWARSSSIVLAMECGPHHHHAKWYKTDSVNAHTAAWCGTGNVLSGFAEDQAERLPPFCPRHTQSVRNL